MIGPNKSLQKREIFKEEERAMGDEYITLKFLEDEINTIRMSLCDLMSKAVQSNDEKTEFKCRQLLTVIAVGERYQGKIYDRTN